MDWIDYWPLFLCTGSILFGASCCLKSSWKAKKKQADPEPAPKVPNFWKRKYEAFDATQVTARPVARAQMGRLCLLEQALIGAQLARTKVAMSGRGDLIDLAEERIHTLNRSIGQLIRETPRKNNSKETEV